MTNWWKKVINLIITIFMLILSMFLFLVGVALPSEEYGVLYLIVFSGLSAFMAWGAVSVYRILEGKERAGKRKKTNSFNKQVLIRKNPEEVTTGNITYCKKCGKENDRNLEFCLYCGERLEISYIKNPTEIYIPAGVTKIDNFAYKGNKNLKKIHLPDSVTEIGKGAFDDSSNLKEINKQEDINNRDMNMDAQKNYDLGMEYINGSDPQKGLHYLELAAKMNHIEAQYWLGYLLSDGTKVKQDAAKGAYYLKMASDNGYTKAHFEYAVSLFNGCGVEVDEKAAIAYMRRSAQEGYTTAQDRMLALTLGLMPSSYVDPDEAELWYGKLRHMLAENTRALFEERINFVRSIKNENNGAPIETKIVGNQGILYFVGGQQGKVYRP